MNRVGYVGTMLLLTLASAGAEPVASRYDIGADGRLMRVTEQTVSGKGRAEVRHELAPGSDAGAARARDVASGQTLPAKVDGRTLVVAFGSPLAERAERRVAFEESLWPDAYLRRSGSSLVFEADLPSGRHVVVLPAAYVVTTASQPAQVLVKDGRLHAGLVVGQAASRVRLSASAGRALSDTAFARSFRADDARSIVYWLEDPAMHRVSLALELYIDRQAQAHAYSQLIKEDNITNPSTLDVDRGVELKTRIVTGAEATAIGDAPAPFAADASVLVADLVQPVPAGGNTRVRLYQTATDAKGYTLQPNGELRYERFLARLRTRIVLPEGWELSSVDQPATIGRDERGRATLDFLEDGGDTSPLLVTARRRDER